MSNSPRILFLDIETSPIVGYVWGLWDNNLALNQIKQDWHLMSWAAKWKGDPDSKIMYMDQRKARPISDDKQTAIGMWELLDEADIIITQNGKKFDQKKLNARFIINGLKPPSSFKHLDTCEIARRKFGFTSNKLEYLLDKLCPGFKKYKSKLFPGQELWTECLARNPKAWNEIEKYNKEDVRGLEVLYSVLEPWDNSINYNLYTGEHEPTCSCGSKEFKLNGYAYLSTGKYQRYSCKKCGAEARDRKNQNTNKNTRVRVR